MIGIIIENNLLIKFFFFLNNLIGIYNFLYDVLWGYSLLCDRRFDGSVNDFI